ncbi:hybrid sensor histidine kinase/response regulator transcription factor [Dyadobacter sp. SG02]|uniref:hybrid sensor histidine kinase/response regulator transcription factor n=1 Tax=Dyadobacter sp. SG02 TaxID=1855291 RepID=UPI000B86EABA|nr:hybrid sensor histidine kinase/response regulator transcription factor [Dyadobacter sp. SG02]
MQRCSVRLSAISPSPSFTDSCTSVYQHLKFLLIGTLLFFGNAYGQVFKNFREVDGIPLSTTLGITQDKQGFMWFGAQAGLYRYDGKTFQRYNVDTGANPKFIRDLLTDPQGNIWIASTTSGLFRYNPDTDTFTNFDYDSTNVNSLSHSSVNCIIRDQKNQIWAGTQYGLSRIVNDHGKIRITRHLQTEFPGVTRLIRSLSEDKAGNIWMATGDGLVKMRNDGSNPRLYRISSIKAQIQLSEIIFVHADNNGIIWLGTNGGVYQFNPVTEDFKLMETLKAPNGEFPSASKMVPDGKGKYWMATSLGLARFDPHTLQAEWYVNRPGDPNSLGNTAIFSTYLDRQGGLWSGSFYAGVSYLHFDSPRFRPWPFATDDSRSRLYSNAWLGKGKGKQIWAISDNQEKLLVFDTHGRNPSSFNLKLSKSADYYAFYLDENDVLWAAGNSIFTSFNLRTGSYQHYPLTIEGESVPVNARTYAIFTDSHKRFWIGGYYGLLLFDQKRGKFIKQTPSNISVRSIYEDSRRNIWIGCANEVYRINAKDSSSVTPPLEKLSVGPETTNYFWRIAEDLNGNIWAAGTNLLFQYNSKSNRFVPNTDVPGGYIKDVVPDRQGYLWVSSVNKLYRYHPQKRTLQSYGYDDGLPQNGELIQGFGTTDASGSLYFLTNAGMFSFDPAAIAVNDHIPPIMLTSLKLYNKEVSTGDSTGLLPEPLWKTKEITFRHDQSIFTIDFALLDYVRSGHNKYAYKIDGIDHNWNYVENPSATYTNLPSGAYIFQVKAANGDGFWMKVPLKIRIVILPPWWKTWYAYLVYILLGACAIYAINRFFWLRSSFRRENALNQVKLDFFTNVSHEIRTHLSLISGPLEKVYEQFKEGKSIESNLNYARSNSDRLMLLVNELLDFRKIQSGAIRLQVQQHDVVRIIKNVIAAFEHTAREKGIETLLFCSDTPVLLWLDIAQMQKVFYNLLSNAYKFTPEGGKVAVRIVEISNEVAITVEDNGNGISQEHLRKLFTYYYQADSQKPGYGIGLALSKSIVEQHHGYLTAESRVATDSIPGSTSLTIRLLRESHHFSADQIAVKGSDYVGGVTAAMITMPVNEVNAFEKQTNTILIIEDNEQLRAFIKDLFQADFNVLEAENGLRGLELAQEHLPDIILSDVMMPEMNGLDLSARLKGNVATSHIPVVLLTARTQSEQVIEGLRAGADDYLIKPFDPRVLQLKINNLIRLRDELKARYRKSLSTDQDTGGSIAQDMNEAFIGKLRAMVIENISEPGFGVNELARQVGMSVSVLYRKIRSLTGMTVNDFVKTIRFNEARQLLESGVYNVNEVASIIGYDSSRHFSNEFKKVFGQNPSEIKKQITG